MIGTTVGPYHFVQRLGDGGMGTVYRATDQMLGRDVAIKVLRADLEDQPALIERFRQEAMVLARLSHPGIATLHGLQPHGASFLMVMEFVPGATLDALLRRQGPVPWTRAVTIVMHMLDALAHAHAQGVVHRDIKPANVMLTPDERVKLMDFGIARLRGVARQTRLGFAVGTPSYMAPEQLRSEDVDGRTDLYAVGLVLYELLTGEAPFVADSDHALMHQQLTAPVPLVSARVPEVPRALEVVIARATAKEPARRYADAAAFRDALYAVATGERPRVLDRLVPVRWRARMPSSSVRDRLATGRWRERAPLAAALAVVLALAAWALQPPAPRPPLPQPDAPPTTITERTARTGDSAEAARLVVSGRREDAQSLRYAPTTPTASDTLVTGGRAGSPGLPPGTTPRESPPRTSPPRETPRRDPPARRALPGTERATSPVDLQRPSDAASGVPDASTRDARESSASVERALGAAEAGAAIAEAFDRLSGRDAAAARALLVGSLQDDWGTLMREGRIRVVADGAARVDAGSARASAELDATVTVRSPFGANRRRAARFRAELQRAGGTWRVTRLVPLGSLELN